MMRLGQAVLVVALGCLGASPAIAVTAAVAKKCDAAAFQAFPNQRIGTSVGIAQRNKFRRDCIEKNGDVASVDVSAAAAAPPSKAK